MLFLDRLKMFPNRKILRREEEPEKIEFDLDDAKSESTKEDE
jgi:hypothetical protein